MPWKIIRIEVIRIGIGLDIQVWTRLVTMTAYRESVSERDPNEIRYIKASRIYGIDELRTRTQNVTCASSREGECMPVTVHKA